MQRATSRVLQAAYESGHGSNRSGSNRAIRAEPSEPCPSQLPFAYVQVPTYVIHWNEPGWCARTVDSLRRAGGDVNVIDNNSAKVPTVPVPVIELPENVGYTGAANVALDRFAGEFVVICAHDAEVAEDTLALMLAAMEDPSVGAVGPNIMRPDGTYDNAIAAIEDREWLDGTCVMLRRACVEDVGRFDDDYGSYWEDVDYGYRIRQAGWRAVRVRNARARGHGTGGGVRSVALRKANAVVFAAKHGGPGAVRRAYIGLAKQAVHAVVRLRKDDTVATARAARIATAKLRLLRRTAGAPNREKESGLSAL